MKGRGMAKCPSSFKCQPMGAREFTQPSPIVFFAYQCIELGSREVLRLCQGLCQSAPWLPLAAAGEDTQHWALLRAQLCTLWEVLSSSKTVDHTGGATSRPIFRIFRMEFCKQWNFEICAEESVGFLSALMPNLNTVLNGKET